MTEEEYFRKNYPDSCYGDRPLSPHWDFFQDGVEFGERQSEKKISELKDELKKWKDEWQEQVQKATDEGYARTLQTMQLTNAKELLERFLGLGNLWNLDCKDYFPLRKEAEQFLKGEFTAEQSNECHDCAKFDEMPNGPRCKTCDNGSHFQKKEEA